MGLLEGVRVVAFGEDDHGAIEGGSEPRDVSMPKQRSSLPGDGEVVNIALPCLYWALSYIRRPICPSTLKLPYSMPIYSFTSINNLINVIN